MAHRMLSPGLRAYQRSRTPQVTPDLPRCQIRESTDLKDNLREVQTGRSLITL